MKVDVNLVVLCVAMPAFFVTIGKIPLARWFRGRILTRPIRRRVRWFAMPPPGSVTRDAAGYRCRASQVIVVSFAAAAASEWLYQAVFWAVSFALILDDYLTGDDERWKRFRDWCGNRVRWLMEMPHVSEPRAPETA